MLPYKVSSAHVIQSSIRHSTAPRLPLLWCWAGCWLVLLRSARCGLLVGVVDYCVLPSQAVDSFCHTYNHQFSINSGKMLTDETTRISAEPPLAGDTVMNSGGNGNSGRAVIDTDVTITIRRATRTLWMRITKQVRTNEDQFCMGALSVRCPCSSSSQACP